jgi:hypothetical protein
MKGKKAFRPQSEAALEEEKSFSIILSYVLRWQCAIPQIG